jgi:hypothetical protein
MIMVDELQRWPTKLRIFHAGACHLTSDEPKDGPLEELHAFAMKIGLRREWFQNHPLAPHYDLTVGRRARALAEGAIFVPARQQALSRRAKRGA